MPEPAGLPKAPGGGGNGHKKTEIKLRMSEQVGAGVYANSMMVQHTADEFVLDFAIITGGRGSIVARVITSPAHMRRIVAALEDNVKKYESLHGPIKPSATGG